MKQLQEWLNQLGYDCGTVDGKYGDKTVAAVKLYQRNHGLTDDGIAGDKTQASIALEIAKQGISGGDNDTGDNLPKVDFEAVKTALKCIKSQAEDAIRLLEEGGLS